MIDRILFVIVTFKVKIEDSKTFNSLVAAAKYSVGKPDIYIYDNSPADFEYKVPDSLSVSKEFNILYNRDYKNSGISKAYNEAFKVALKLKKEWLLFLDQDTLLPPNTIIKYIETIKLNSSATLLAPIIRSAQNKKIVSPCLYQFGRGFYLKEFNPGISQLNKKSLINCGLCVSTAAFSKAGGYNPLIKLDFSDFYFIENYKSRVSKNFFAIDLELIHSLSTTETQTLEQDKSRFLFYLEGGQYFGRSMNTLVLIFLNALIRALKLSVVHKNITFLRLLFLYYFRNNGI